MGYIFITVVVIELSVRCLNTGPEDGLSLNVTLYQLSHCAPARII